MEEPKKKDKKNRSREELEQSIRRLQKKLRWSRQQLQQTSSQMEVQAARTRQLVQAWSGRVERAEERVRRERMQKDTELRNINGQLMLLQGQLKKEQQLIMNKLLKKNRIISDQKKTIEKLQQENKRLQEEVTSKTEDNADDQYVTLASIDEMVKRKNSAQFILQETQDWQKAFDKVESSSQLNKSGSQVSGRDLAQDSFSEINITQDDVFKDISFDLPRGKSENSLPKVYATEPRMRSKTFSALDPSVEYSNHKMVKRKANISKVDSKSKSSRQQRSKHMSFDIDLNRSFDSVTFADSSDYPREGNVQADWYISSSDKENEDIKHLESASFIVTDDGETSARDFGNRMDNLYHWNIENTLRHKTVKRKRKRSKSLSERSRMPVIFLAQSEPDIPHAEVNIDEAILRRRKPKMEIV